MNITQMMHNVWTQITSTPLFGVTLTVLSYRLSYRIKRLTDRIGGPAAGKFLAPLMAQN